MLGAFWSSREKEKPVSMRHGPGKYRGRSAEHWCQDWTRPLWMAVPWIRKVHHKWLIDRYRFATEFDSDCTGCPSSCRREYVGCAVCSMALGCCCSLCCWGWSLHFAPAKLSSLQYYYSIPWSKTATTTVCSRTLHEHTFSYTF